MIAGNQGVTKLGGNMLTLTGANTYSGNTLISQGTLQLGNNLALQNSALDTTGTGTLAFSSGVTTPTFGGLTGANNLTLPSSVTALTLNLGSGVTQTIPALWAAGGHDPYHRPAPARKCSPAACPPRAIWS